MVKNAIKSREGLPRGVLLSVLPGGFNKPALQKLVTFLTLSESDPYPPRVANPTNGPVQLITSFTCQELVTLNMSDHENSVISTPTHTHIHTRTYTHTYTRLWRCHH